MAITARGLLLKLVAHADEAVDGGSGDTVVFLPVAAEDVVDVAEYAEAARNVIGGVHREVADIAEAVAHGDGLGIICRH